MDKSQQNIIIYNSVDDKASVSLYAKDGHIWMNQNQIAELFDTSKQNIGQHITNILNDKELQRISVVKNFFTTANDGKDYQVTFYALDMVLAIGFRVRSKVRAIYTEYDSNRKKHNALQADMEDLKALENKIKKAK